MIGLDRVELVEVPFNRNAAAAKSDQCVVDAGGSARVEDQPAPIADESLETARRPVRRRIERSPRAEAIVFSAPASDGQMRAVGDIPAALPTDGGERLVANPRGRNVLRALPTGRFVSIFAVGNVSRMVQNWVGDVAMIDKSTKSIVIADRDGKTLAKIAAKGTGYEFADPVDLVFDGLDHLYVLDRGRSSIFVFGPDNKLMSTLTLPDKSPGALSRGEAIGVDPAGRLYVFDDRSRRIQVYQ